MLKGDQRACPDSEGNVDYVAGRKADEHGGEGEPEEACRRKRVVEGDARQPGDTAGLVR